MSHAWSRFTGGLLLGPLNVPSPTTSPNIDSAFNFESSGDAFGCKFVCPVTHSGTLTVYVYVVSVTNTPEYQLHVRNGAVSPGDIDRPESGGSEISSSPSTAVLSTSDAGTWIAVTCDVNLTQGATYWALITRSAAGSPSGWATFRATGSVAFAGSSSSEREAHVTVYTTNGFTTDPTTATNGFANSVILKFSDGTLIGNPYVTSSTPASAAEDRGFRLTPDADLLVSGICFGTAALTSITDLAIYESDGTEIVKVDITGLYSTINDHMTVRFAPVRLKAGTSYDVVRKSVTALTHPTLYEMGEVEANVPADVLACRPPGWAYVSGTTPGSYAVDASKLVRAILWVDLAPPLIGWGNKRGNRQ